MVMRSFACTALLLACALAPAGCDSDGSTDADRCELGDRLSCRGEDGCEGARRCGGEPLRFGPCVCTQPPPPVMPDDAGARPVLGAACERNAQCPAGAFCMRAPSERLFGGAPPVGTCAADCEGSEDCERFAQAVCVPAGPDGEGLCLEGCQLGESSASKCHGRAHVACSPLEDSASGEQGYCRPLCAIDADCEQGGCDPATGSCIAEPRRDPDFGLRCAVGNDGDADGGIEPDAGTRPGQSVGACTGACVELNDAPSLCSRRCMFGAAGECAPTSGGLRRGACLFVTPGGSIDDLGYCAELCDCNDDCIEPTFICDELPETLRSVFGRAGVCTDPALVLGRELECEPDEK